MKILATAPLGLRTFRGGRRRRSRLPGGGTAQTPRTIFRNRGPYNGTDWSNVLVTIPGGANLSTYQNSGDLTIPASCINANFQLRFLTSAGTGDNDYFYFDNIKISLSGRTYTSGVGGAPPNLASGYTLYPYESLTAVVTVTVNSDLSPSITQIQNIATVAADGGVNQPATASNPVLPAPVVSSPINAGASSIPGTSAAPVGSTITVYSNGVSIGTTTVESGGTWTLFGVSGLLGGESITAVGSTTGATSAVSNAVVVTPAAPVVTGPIVAGATSASGTSTAPVGCRCRR